MHSPGENPDEFETGVVITVRALWSEPFRAGSAGAGDDGRGSSDVAGREGNGSVSPLSDLLVAGIGEARGPVSSMGDMAGSNDNASLFPNDEVVQ